LLQRLDAKARKNIPESAKWQMKHKPYLMGGSIDNDNKGHPGTVLRDEKGG
jgi:hypothetical protein